MRTVSQGINPDGRGAVAPVVDVDGAHECAPYACCACYLRTVLWSVGPDGAVGVARVVHEVGAQ